MALELLANATITQIPQDVDETSLPFDGSDQSALVCNIAGCGREFSSRRNLVDHIRGHHQGSKPHLCSFPNCGKSFLRPAHLIIHERIHTGEKPFVCEYKGCGKRWNQKSALKQHMRSHTGEKPFLCSVDGCGKQFSTSSSCKRHVLTHQQQLPHQASPLHRQRQGDEQETSSPELTLLLHMGSGKRKLSDSASFSSPYSSDHSSPYGSEASSDSDSDQEYRMQPPPSQKLRTLASVAPLASLPPVSTLLSLAKTTLPSPSIPSTVISANSSDNNNQPSLPTLLADVIGMSRPPVAVLPPFIVPKMTVNFLVN